MLLKGLVVAVTGAAAGMGRAYATGIVEEGGRVIALDLNKAGLESLASELGDGCIPVPCDLAREGGKALEEGMARAGRLDGLINNAGLLCIEDFVNHSEDEYDRILGANLRGPFLTCQAAVRHWTSNGLPGRIVNISSRGGIWSKTPRMAAYAASKAGVMGLTMNIAEEVTGLGISVNAVCPRARTAMSNLTPEELEAQKDVEARSPRQMVGPVLYLASPLASWLTGQLFVVDDGRLQWLHGWHSVSGITKGSRWEPQEMDGVFKQLTGVQNHLADDAFSPWQAVAGIAARGRVDWQ